MDYEFPNDEDGESFGSELLDSSFDVELTTEHPPCESFYIGDVGRDPFAGAIVND